MKKAIFNVSALTAVLAPAVAFAQYQSSGPNFNYINSTVSEGGTLLQTAVTYIMIAMTLFFLYSVLRFIMDKGEKAEETASKRKAMINGLIGLFVAVGVWGIIHLAGNVTGIDTTNPNQQSAITCPPGFSQVNGLCQPSK